MIRVTDTKLRRASEALLALYRCDDIEERLDAHHEKVSDAFFATHGYPMPADREPPRVDDIVGVAAALSAMLDLGDDEGNLACTG